LRRAAAAAASGIAAALGSADPGMAFAAMSSTEPPTAYAAGTEARLVAAIAALPNGVRRMSPDIPGMVVLSSSLGVAGPAESGPGSLELRVLARSAEDAVLLDYLGELERYLSPAGFACRRLEPNAAWAPDLASPLLALARKVYTESHGRQPVLRATHGGLECGLFRRVYPDWDMLSIGPSIRFPHSPDEAINIDSVGRFWKFLRALVSQELLASS
jgi:dipeptidase D